MDPGSTVSPSAGTVQYVAPELLNPSGFGLEDSVPTKKSDMYAFGMITYQVGNLCFISGITTKGKIQVITGQQPFPGVKDGVVIYDVVSGERPCRPSDPNKWTSENVWNFISGCWSPSLNIRPDVNFATTTLTNAADAVDVTRGILCATANNQGEGTSHQVSGTSDYHRS